MLDANDLQVERVKEPVTRVHLKLSTTILYPVRSRAYLASLGLLAGLCFGPIASPSPAVAKDSCHWDTAPGWVARENQKTGEPSWDAGIAMEFAGDFSAQTKVKGIRKWLVRSLGPKTVEGWLDSTTASCGDHVGLHLSGNAAPITIKVYRMGFYGGASARLIEQSVTKPIPQYPSPTISSPPLSTVSTKWPVAWVFEITRETLPGQYLIRLDDHEGKSTFVPITVTDPEAKSDITVISSVLTWQAYNQWGGYSLYKGPNLKRVSRSAVVSFNRPYDGDGSGQFRYMELPVLRLAEKLGLDLNYITDLELNSDANSLRNTKSILYGGHGEYWTSEMRLYLQNAINRGVNLVSLGGNAGYNRPRLQSNDREMVMWRGAQADPKRTDPILATVTWRSSPINKSESLLLGSQYVGLGVDGDYTIAHSTRWPFNVMKHPELLKNIVGREVDSPLYAPGPAVEELARSSINLHGRAITTMATYYTNAKGAGILDIGTNGWTCAMDDICPWHPNISKETQLDARLVTEEILIGIAKGPLGLWRPAITDIPARTALLSVAH